MKIFVEQNQAHKEKKKEKNNSNTICIKQNKITDFILEIQGENRVNVIGFNLIRSTQLIKVSRPNFTTTLISLKMSNFKLDTFQANYKFRKTS